MGVRQVRYLLIGGGLASSSAAEAIRHEDPSGSILLLSQEIVRPYQRPPLNKRFLRRQAPRESLFTHDRDWFELNHVELRTGRRALRLDVARSTAMLDNGEAVRYDQVLIATGLTPVLLDVPGSNLPNLFYLRTLEDAERLHHAIDKARHEGRFHIAHARSGPRGKAVVIGAGLLGVEIASSLAQVGVAVDLICSREHPWPRFAGQSIGRAATASLQKLGVCVEPFSRPLRIEGDGRVQRVVTNSGRVIECDFAVAAVGATLSREILRDTPLAAEISILSDVRCRTNVPNVYAAGDCAAVFDPLFAKHRLIDHWEHASRSGAIAGANMAGRAVSYDGVNHYSSEALDPPMHAWGESRLIDRRITRDTGHGGERRELVEIGVGADGRVCHVCAVWSQGDDRVFRNLVSSRMSTIGLEERLRDPSTAMDDVTQI